MTCIRRLCVWGLFFLLLCGGTGGVSWAGSCLDLVDKYCVSCHATTHVCPKMEKKADKDAWEKTMRLMVSYGMDPVPEHKKLVNCLVKRKKDIRQRCAGFSLHRGQ